MAAITASFPRSAWERNIGRSASIKDERYCGESRLRQLAWSGSDIFTPHPVGQKQANGLGIYDMTGNVMEWCQDRYGPYPAMQDAAMDPTGPETGYQRVYRGGCINSADFELRSTAREGMRPDFADYYFGIRLVKNTFFENI